MGRGKEEGGVSELTVVVKLLLSAFQLFSHTIRNNACFLSFHSILFLSFNFGLSCASGEMMPVKVKLCQLK